MSFFQYPKKDTSAKIESEQQGVSSFLGDISGAYESSPAHDKIALNRLLEDSDAQVAGFEEDAEADGESRSRRRRRNKNNSGKKKGERQDKNKRTPVYIPAEDAGKNITTSLNECLESALASEDEEEVRFEVSRSRVSYDLSFGGSKQTIFYSRTDKSDLRLYFPLDF